MTYYTVKQAEIILNVSKRTIYNYLKHGELEAVKDNKSWLIKEDSLLKLIHKGTAENYLNK